MASSREFLLAGGAFGAAGQDERTAASAISAASDWRPVSRSDRAVTTDTISSRPLSRETVLVQPRLAGRTAERKFMREIAYTVRGFLTVHKDSLRVPLSGSLTVHADPDSGLFTGDLVLDQSTIRRTVLGASLFSGTVQIRADPPVIGRIDHEGRLLATATVEAVITAGHAAGRTLISGDSCRTATHATVPLHSKPGFSLDQGGRVAGRYYRPPFTGCGWITPLVNLLASGSGNAAVIDLIPAFSRD